MKTFASDRKSSSFKLTLILLLSLTSYGMGQSFVPTGGTVNSGYWNSTNTGGTFTFVIPNDPLIAFLAMNIDVNDAGAYAEIGAQEFGVSAQQSKTYTRTATEIETAGGFSDGDSYDIHVIFFKTSGGIAAVDTLTIESNVIVDQTAPAAFTVGSVVAAGGNVAAGYWNDSNTSLAVTVPIAADASLQGGSLQIKGFVGGNPAEDLGSSANVLIINTNQTVTLADTDFVNKVWFLDNQTFSLTATLSDAAGNSTEGSASVTTLTIDQMAPTISSITSSSADGTYGVGGTISITVNFDQAVTLSNGNLLTNLNSGVQLSTAVISGASSFTEVYTVSEGDDATDLSVSSFALSGGATKLLDAAGNNTDLNTISSNLDANTDIVVDGSTPSVTSITSTTSNGSYGVGETVNVTINFSEALTLSGGNLLVDIDASGTNLVISPFTSQASVTADYIVATTDASSDLTVSTLSLSAGTLVDGGGNSVDLSLVGVSNIDDTKNIAIDGAAPAAFTVGAATVTGGSVVGGYWNSTNTGMTVVVPIANDASLDGGTVQIQGFFGDISGAENIASTSALNGSHVGGSITVTLADTDIEAITGFTNTATLKLTAILADAGGNATTGTQSANTFVIDQQLPVISSIGSTTADGTYGIGDDVNVTITFSENVTLSLGNLLTTMNTSAVLSEATIVNTNTLSQTYTIAALEETTDLTVSNLALSGGSVLLNDAAGNPTTLSLPVSNLATTSAIEVDGIVPTVSTITSSTANGSYGVGDLINIRVTFSEAVTLTGGNLEVDHDASATNVLITSISSALFGEQTYTVADGDASADLTVTALSLSAGTLQDAGGNDVDLTDLTGVSNLAASSDLVVDGAAPADFTVGTVTVTGGDIVAAYWNSTNTGMTVSVPIAADNGLVGGTVQAQGYFNDISGAANVGDPVTIVGGNLGGNIVINLSAAQVEGIAGFAEDEVLKLTAVITDDGGNATTGTQSANTFTLDQSAPALNSISSTSVNGTYGVGDGVNVTLNFDEAVTLSGGNLIITLNTGAELTQNTISGTATVSQTYTISESEQNADLTVSDLELSAGTVDLIDAAGNQASLTLPVGSNIADASAIVIDGIYPTVASISSTTSNGSYGIGDQINITVTFSEAVTLSAGNLEVDIDASATDVLITSISSSTTGTATYTIISGDASTDLNVTALTLSAGTLQDAGGNDVNLADISGISNIDDTRNIVVDGDVPAAFQVAGVVTTGGVVVADYWNGTNTGLSLSVPIADDQSLQGGKVIVTGRVGSNAFEAVGDSVSILAVNTSKTITLSSNAVQGITGFAEGAVLSFSAIMRDAVYNFTTGTASATTLTIDEVAPNITGITSNPASGDLGVGASSDITVTFNESVTLSGGNVRVTLETGTSDAVLTETSISAANSFVETYTVAESESSNDLDVNTISLSTGTLRDVAGNGAIFTLPVGNNLADNSALVVDGVYPTIESITSTTANGEYGFGESINVTLTFSEALTLAGGNLLVTLETGTTDRQVTISTISNSTTATGVYTIQAGDVSSDLAVSTISLSAGTLTDAASNSLDLTLPTGVNSLAGSKALVVDGSVPEDFTVGSVTATGGVVTSGYWNASNTGLSIIVPIDNDGSLLTGSLQIRARTGVNAYENLGALQTISSIGVNKTTTFTATTLENITGFDEAAVIEFTAIITDSVGNATTGTASATTLTVDQVIASISSIISDPVGDNLGVGESALLTINFSENVTLAGGNLLTTLETGTTDEILTASTLVASNSLDQTYTVSEGHLSSDLTAASITLSAGNLRDIAGNNVSLTLPVGNNLADNSALVVDGVVPSIVDITSTSDDNLDYALGDEIVLVVTFSEAVTLSGGNFQLTLETGVLDQVQTIGTINNASSASVTYTVGDGDASSDLSVLSASLSAGTFKDAAGNDVDMNILPGSNLDDVYTFVVDGTAPADFTVGTVISIGGTVVSNYYNATNTGVRVTVPIANDASLQNGDVQVQVKVGSNAFEDLGTASQILAVDANKNITIANADIIGITGYDEDLILTFTAIISDSVGNSTTGTASANVFTIDRVVPSITGITSVPGTAELSIGETADITVSFSETVTLAGGNLLTTLETGDTDAILTTTAITNASFYTETYTIASDEASNDLTVSSIALSSGTLRDAAGNTTDLTLPVGNNLADNSALVVDGGTPVITSISSTTIDGAYGLATIVNFDIDFSEAVTLIGGELIVTLETGDTDRNVNIGPFNQSTSTSGTYTVQAGDISSDLTVSSIILSAGTFKDAAGNDVDLDLPVGQNLGDNNDFQIDGSVPGAFDSGDMITLGDPVVTDFWNLGNTAFEVIVPIEASDASLIGGSVYLELQIDANGWEQVGGNTTILDLNPISMAITRAEMETDLSGYLGGGTIYAQAVIVDNVGNQTTGTQSSNALLIDHFAPTATVTGDILVIGGTATQGYWNPSNTSMTISTAVGNDATLVGGTMQMEMRVGNTGLFESVGLAVSIVADNSTVPVTLADQVSFDVADGDTVVFRAVVTDVSGNATTGTVGTSELIIDVTLPGADQVGAVIATSGNVVQNYFNATNLGGTVTVPIDAGDPTLIGGSVQLIALVNGTGGSFSTAESIDDLNDITFVFTEITLDNELDYVDGDVITFQAEVRDVAGNLTTFSVSDQYFELDETIPEAFVSEDIIPTGGTVIDGYWNSTNTGVIVKVPLSDDGSPNDGSLIEGYLSVSADIIEPDDGTFETFTTTATITSLGSDTISVTIPAAELEALDGGTGFGEGLSVIFRTTITDVAGNAVTTVTSSETLAIDQTDPVPPTITGLRIVGENVADGIWNAVADSLLIAVPVTSPDPTLQGGFLQVYMTAGAVFADDGELVIDDMFPITGGEDTIRIAGVDVGALTTFNDGLSLYTQIFIQDRAGNSVLGGESGHVLLIDITPPNPFTAGAFRAQAGDTTVVNGYNNTNDGVALTIPIPNDATLENGTAILKIAINAGTLPPFESFEDVASFTIPDPVGLDSLTLTLTHAELSALTGYQDGASIHTLAEVIDVGGNSTVGGASNNTLFVDLVGPDIPVPTDTSTVGGTLSESYWNGFNTALTVTIPTPALTDNSLLGGHFQVQGRVGFEVNYANMGDPVPITSVNFTTGTANIDATDVESLFGFTDGLPIDLIIHMEDGYGNDTLSASIDDWRIIDQGNPVAGIYINESTTTVPFIKGGDTLRASWQGFSDAISGIGSYEFSVGTASGANDVLGWQSIATTEIDTSLTYSHGQSYYMNTRARDGAGNLSDTLSSVSIVADLIAPLSTIDIDPFYFIDLWPGSFGGTYSDELSLVDSLYLGFSRSSDNMYWDGSAWVADSTVVELSFDAATWSYTLAAGEMENRVNYRIQVLAVDIAGNRQEVAALDSFEFVINTPPVMAAINDTSSLEDSEYTHFIQASDVDLGTVSGDTLFYSLRVGPDSMTVDTSNGLITWTPNDADVGNHIIRVLVQDVYGEADSTTFTLTVIEVNDAPEAVTLLLPADSTQLVAADSLLLTFKWTTAFDIEEDALSYRLLIRNAGYDTILTTSDTSITVDVSVMDFPVELLNWHVLALDEIDTSAVADSFRVITSPAFANLNTTSIDVELDRYASLDTLFNIENLGLTNLRWSLVDAPTWITLVTESGLVHFQDNFDVEFNMDIAEFTIGSYAGVIRVTTNDPLQDTISVAVSMTIFDTPTPVLAFYKNPVYPSIYELMIVDTLGMIDTLMVTQDGDTLVTREVSDGSYSYIATVAMTSEGSKRFVVYASNWTGDTTLTRDVTVSLARSNTAWTARSPDDLFEVSGKAGSVLSKSHVTVLDTLLSAMDEARYKVMSDGLELADPVLVSMPEDETGQAIYIQNEAGDYVELASVSDGERVSAWTDRMGAFQLGPRTIIVPEKSQLAQNFPNPFNPSTTIRFDIGFLDGLNQDVVFDIYNIRGQRVDQLMNTQLQPGSYSVSWNGLDESGIQVSSGIYFARLITGKGYVKTVKMLVLR